MSFFEPPGPLVLRDEGQRRTVIAHGTFTGQDGEKVAFVRIGVQFRTESGEWRWSKGEGASVPLRMLGKVAAWLVDCARAIPRPEPTRSNGWGQ